MISQSELYKLTVEEDWYNSDFYYWKVYPFGKKTKICVVTVGKTNIFYRLMTRFLLNWYWEKLEEPVRGWY